MWKKTQKAFFENNGIGSLILNSLNRSLLLTGCHLKSMSFDDLVVKINHSENSFTISSSEIITFKVAKRYHFWADLEHLYHSMISDHKPFTLESDQTLKILNSGPELLAILHRKVPENYQLELLNVTPENLKTFLSHNNLSFGFIL